MCVNALRHVVRFAVGRHEEGHVRPCPGHGQCVPARACGGPDPEWRARADHCGGPQDTRKEVVGHGAGSWDLGKLALRGETLKALGRHMPAIVR
jgi:hypothetical protein